MVSNSRPIALPLLTRYGIVPFIPRVFSVGNEYITETRLLTELIRS